MSRYEGARSAEALAAFVNVEAGMNSVVQCPFAGCIYACFNWFKCDVGVVTLEYFELLITNLARWFEDINELAFPGMLDL